MKRSIGTIPHFFGLFGLWLLLGGTIVGLTEQESLHLTINRFHYPALDVFFKYATYLGDGLFAAFIVLLAGIYRLRYGLIALLSTAVSGILTQLLKRMVFADSFRPAIVFKDLPDLYLVPGIDMHSHFSFPSGHATTAFATFMVLAFMSRSVWLQWICFLGAILVAFSRVYISQHFFEDIYAGSIVGASITLVVIYFLGERSWGQDGLLSKFDRS